MLLSALVAVAPPISAHPHDEDEIVVLTGTLTKINLERQTVELDVFDRQERGTRNLLLFVEAKAKLTDGKRRIALTELVSGQQVTVTAERVANQGSRLVAFEIRVNGPK